MKRWISLCLCLLLAVLPAGCGSGGEKQQKRFEASFLELFDTVTKIVGYAPDEASFTAQAQQIHDRLESYHRLYDIYNDYEGIANIKTINDNAGKAPVKVDRRIIDLLKFSQKMDELTGGRVNVGFGAVLSLWHEYREAGIDDPEHAQLPPMDELQERARHTDLSRMVIDEAASTVYLSDSQMRLDVGAIAKGYATERVAEELEAEGLTHYMLSVGGNIRALGAKPDKAGGETDWNVGIQNPDLESSEKNVYILNLRDASLVTSGVYERYYVVDGKRYHHIIEPESLMPSSRYQSVSIVCHDSGMADALSTSIFNMSPEEGLRLIESLPDTEALWIMADGSQAYSSGFMQMVKDRQR